jgi:protein SCO1/2
MGPTPRTRLPLWAVAAAAGAAALLLGGVALSLASRPAASPTGAVLRSTGEADIGGPFTLTDHTGAAFTEADLLGRPSLIYFGYTFCPDVCPLSLQVMQRALERLPEERRAAVRPVFVSVDPERDTVERLARYVETPGFPPGLTGLTGTPEQVEAAKTEFRIYSAKGAEAGDFYLVDHTSLIYLMDSDGTFVAAFGHTESPETIAAAVDNLLS